MRQASRQPAVLPGASGEGHTAYQEEQESQMKNLIIEHEPLPEAIEGFINGSYFMLSYSPRIEELLCVWPKQAPRFTEGTFKPFPAEAWKRLKEFMVQVDYEPYVNQLEDEAIRTMEMAKEMNK